MIELEYSLIIEATKEPDYFGFYSPDLEGFTGIGHHPIPRYWLSFHSGDGYSFDKCFLDKKE